MNQFLFYPRYGLSEVVKNDNGMLTLFLKRSKMKVQIHENMLAKLQIRELSSPEKVQSALAVLESKTVRLGKKNWNQIQNGYKEKIQSGDLVLIAEVAAEIKGRTSPTFGEKKILESCTHFILDEASVVLGPKHLPSAA